MFHSLVGLKLVIGLPVATALIVLLAHYLRRRPAPFAPALAGMASGAEGGHRATTVGIEQIRQRLQAGRAQFKGAELEAFDAKANQFVALLRERYGDQVPPVEAMRLLRDLRPEMGAPAPAVQDAGAVAHVPAAAAANAAAGRTGALADGVTFEPRPAGFLLRASCRSLAGAAVWLIFAAVLGVVPFILWKDLILGFWADQGLNFWLTGVFFAAWAGGILYTAGMGALGLFGEIRIARSGDDGEIFKGIGPVGWTHRLRWSEFCDVADLAAAERSTKDRFSHTIHYIGLQGTGRSYRFGSELPAPRQAFLIGFLRKEVYGHAAPAAASSSGPSR